MKFPAEYIAQKLNSEGKLPKTARSYNRNIVYSVLNGRSKDENVMQKIKELESKLA